MTVAVRGNSQCGGQLSSPVTPPSSSGPLVAPSWGPVDLNEALAVAPALAADCSGPCLSQSEQAFSSRPSSHLDLSPLPDPPGGGLCPQRIQGRGAACSRSSRARVAHSVCKTARLGAVGPQPILGSGLCHFPAATKCLGASVSSSVKGAWCWCPPRGYIVRETPGGSCKVVRTGPGVS